MEAYQNAGEPIVYLDESGFAHDMPRQYGYAPVGKPGIGKYNWHAKGHLNVVGAWLTSYWLTVSLFSGTFNANTFYAGVAPDLLPKLPPHSVMVMDNADFYQRADIRQLIEPAGHRLKYLPAYSPDLNPIEHKWAQAKSSRHSTR